MFTPTLRLLCRTARENSFLIAALKGRGFPSRRLSPQKTRALAR